MALQGGGSHGAFTWGVLDRLLEEERLSFEGISATSAGAVHAVVLADGLAAGNLPVVEKNDVSPVRGLRALRRVDTLTIAMEAEQKGFRHFLEVFDPNRPEAVEASQLPAFINDAIVRTLGGVTSKGRPVFLKMVYHGPQAMEELVHYDPHLVVGILGGSAGTTYDAFKLLAEAKKYGARVALFGRKINNAENQLAFIHFLRLIADGEIEPVNGATTGSLTGDWDPGAADLLRACRKRGLRVILASSADEREFAALRTALDADDAVDDATSSADVQRSKPAPDLVRIALDKAGVPPEAAVFVGDTVWDVRASQAAGVPCIGLLSGGISRGELLDAGAVRRVVVPVAGLPVREQAGERRPGPAEARVRLHLQRDEGGGAGGNGQPEVDHPPAEHTQGRHAPGDAEPHEQQRGDRVDHAEAAGRQRDGAGHVGDAVGGEQLDRVGRGAERGHEAPQRRGVQQPVERGPQQRPGHHPLVPGQQGE